MPAQINAAHQPSVASFLQTVQNVDRSSFSDDGERTEALLAAYALVSRLESPWDAVSRIGLTQPALGASLKIAKDLDLFAKWHAQDGKPRSSKQLAELVGVEEVLFYRFVRHMASNNVLEEVSTGLYKQTAFSISLIKPVFGGWIDYLYDATLPCFHKLPEYLAKTGYKNPEDPADGVFQYAKGSTGTLFDYYDANPRESKTFDDMMGGVMQQQAGWPEIFDTQTLLKGLANDDSAVVVDVGGNVGRDLNRFRVAHPEVAHRLVLEDRAEVIDDTVLPPPTKAIAHNFFEEQPVKGARAYYMHGVIHDWSDVPSRVILQRLKTAMKPGYSKILIHDHVLPEGHPHPQATAYDLTMMVKVAAMERSESAWHKLVESVGLKIVKFWKTPLAPQAVIEVEVK